MMRSGMKQPYMPAVVKAGVPGFNAELDYFFHRYYGGAL